ncbi:MAG TPA: hypothetical protein VMD97_13450 [Candidatus Aquilonibacter sp.]|nr:hypothetical protein [Candidatus Aquilonibacter sp.]
MNPTAKLAKTSATAARWIACVTAIAATLSAGLATAQTTAAAHQDSRIITLTIYNYAHVSPNALQAAEEEADRILSNAGLRARWFVCPTLDERACTSGPSANAYVLQLLTNATDVTHATPDVLGGLARGGSGRQMATIFYDRVNNLAGGDTSPSQVLMGRVIAREVGLLLGLNTSPHGGIMQTTWSENQLTLLGGSDVLFTPRQAHTMQARLAQQATPSMTVAAITKPSSH